MKNGIPGPMKLGSGIFFSPISSLEISSLLSRLRPSECFFVESALEQVVKTPYSGKGGDKQ
jgi:hypothetical protein